MPYTTLTLRQDVAKRLKASKSPGESYSDVLNRLLDNQPARTVGEWLDSLAPIEGRGLFSPDQRERLKKDQVTRRDSHARRKSDAAA